MKKQLLHYFLENVDFHLQCIQMSIPSRNTATRVREQMTKCFCKSYMCNGRLITIRAMKRHVAKDYSDKKQQEMTAEENKNIAPMCLYYPTLYDQHWTSTTPLYEGSPISVLDHIYMEFNNFVSHPSHTKCAVSTTFETNSRILPQPNKCCKSFDEARAAISDFLLPIVKYDVCPNDCIIFTGENKDKKVCFG